MAANLCSQSLLSRHLDDFRLQGLTLLGQRCGLPLGAVAKRFIVVPKKTLFSVDQSWKDTGIYSAKQGTDIDDGLVHRRQ